MATREIGGSMIAVINRLPVKEGMADQVVERFANGQGFVQTFPGFVSMEVLRAEETDDIVVITRWQDKADFDAWVASDAFKIAHGRGGGGGLLRGHPQMDTYEFTVTREATRSGD
jgi:heme-degrading monooxygenase HmoA